jgi:hypothetical protein
MTGTFMRKALLPMLASFVLCGAATAALIVTTAHAQPERKPMMVAQVTGMDSTAPATMGGRSGREMGRDMNRAMPTPAEMAARLRQMCHDRYARQAGALAYLEAKLSLTPAEQPLFEHWKQVKLDVAKRQGDACAAREKPNTAKLPSLVDRMAQREARLQKRLADMQAERPALESFYNALSPEQKREFGRGVAGLMMLREHRMFAGGPGMMGHGMMGHRMGPGMMERGMMGPGMMMHRGPMGMDGPPSGPGNAPPGSPPQ